MRKPPAWLSRAALPALVVGGASLLLPSLGAVRLWQDEAETALLGRNVLRSGLPRVWDGRNLVAQYYSLDFDRHLVFQKGWLPAYGAAASFALLDETTLAARLPFALCGLATIVLCRRLALRLGAGGLEAFLAAALLASSMPFLLYARQCRWYAPAMALTLLLFEAEDRLAEERGWLWLGSAVVGLFHTNPLVCATTVAGLLVARLATRGRAALDAPLVRAGAFSAVLCVPFLLAFPPFAFAGEATHLAGYARRLAWIVGDFNRWVLPLPGALLLLALARGGPLRDPRIRRLLLGASVTVALSAVPMWEGLVEIVGFRYAVNLLPVGAILLARLLAALPLRPWLALGALALQLGTHALGYPFSAVTGAAPDPFLRSDLVDYLGSLLRPVKGPIDAAVEYLGPRVRPGDALFTPYEQLPFQFYLPVRTVGLQGAATTLRRLGLRLPPYVSDIYLDDLDWYVPRTSWNGFLGAPMPAQLLAALAARRIGVEPRELVGPDTAWQTREYPPMCPFRPPVGAPRLVVYRVRRTADAHASGR